MNYSEIFHFMRPELTLIVTIALLFLFDLFAPERLRRYFHPLACVLLTVQILVNIVPTPDSGQLFGGMYQYEPMQSIVKSMLAIGTFVVFLQSNEWLRREDTAHKRGEFYLLTLSTLLGMYFMISAGNFLMFFLGMELASIPMACLIAFDKYRHNSAEAGAKYILCALFSSGLMLYGISFLYGTTGTLYFGDMAARIDGSPLQVMALVFFLSGLGFKISLVPFHLWTADAYQGAPAAVVISPRNSRAATMALMPMMPFPPVSFLASRISLRSSSNAMPDAAMSPIPPSCATAAAKRAVDSLIAIPPCMIGTSAVKSPILSTGSFNKYPPFQDYCNCQGKLLRAFP